MGRTAAGALLAAVMVAVVVGVDLLIFRHHFWERLGAVMQHRVVGNQTS